MKLNKNLFENLMNSYESTKYFSLNYSYPLKEKDFIRELMETFEEERSLGGENKDCWGGSLRIDESSFCDYSELQNFLEKNYILTKIQLKMLLGLQNIERKTKYQDYYGGSEEVEIKKILLEDLSEALILLGIVEEKTEIDISEYVKDFNENREKYKEIAMNKIRSKRAK